MGHADTSSGHFSEYITKRIEFFSFLGDPCLKTGNRDPELKY